MSVPNQLPRDANNEPPSGGWDTSGHQIVVLQVGTPSTDGSTGVQYAPLMTVVSSGTINAQGSPDSGNSYKYLKTTSDGTVVTNANIQPGTALVGATMDYFQYIARGLSGAVKQLVGSVALGTTQSAAITFKDQTNTNYTQTANKTLYIAHIDATCDYGASSALQSTLLTLTDGSNLRYECLVTSTSAPRRLPMPIALQTGSTLTVKAGASNLGTPAGNLYVTILGWEE